MTYNPQSNFDIIIVTSKLLVKFCSAYSEIETQKFSLFNHGPYSYYSSMF